MHAGRYLGASLVVFVVRTVLNWLVYGYALHGRYEELAAAHPGMFREVIPAFISLDLIAALFITYLIVKAGIAFGDGVKGGAILGLFLGVLGPVLASLYYYFSSTYYTSDLVTIESVYQIASHAIQGALAAMIYKTV